MFLAGHPEIDRYEYSVRNMTVLNSRCTSRNEPSVASHDSGMIVVILERECPAFSVSGDTLLLCVKLFLVFL